LPVVSDNHAASKMKEGIVTTDGKPAGVQFAQFR
jgi:hypothetical protein